MSNEHGQFGKWITPDKTAKGVIIVGGEKLKNPVKAIRIHADVLDDLTSLAIEAFAGEFEDSMGQSYLEDAIQKLHTKYPWEQPHEVWRRRIARLATGAVAAEDVAGALLTRSERFMASVNLNSVTPEGREKALNILENKVKEYWPSAPQRG